MRFIVLCTQPLSTCTFLALYINGKLKMKPMVQNRRPHIACTRRINSKHNRQWFKTLGNMKSDGETWPPVVQNRGQCEKGKWSEDGLACGSKPWADHQI